MQLKSVQQPEQSYKYFQDNMASSRKSLQVFKQFLQGVHQLCKKFGEDLQHLYQLVNVQVDDEENLAQNTILSNYILSISQVIKNRSDMLYEESIEPFLQFEENYSQLNDNLDQEYGKIISDLKQNHEILKFKQLEYLLNNFQRYFEKGNKQIFGDSEQQYRIALTSMNSTWDEYFKKSHQLFNNFQLNDESRVSVVEQATFKFLEIMELMFKQPTKIHIQRLKNSFANQKQKMKNRDLFVEMTISSKRLMEFFKQPKCDQYYSRDDYFKIQSQALLQQAQSSGNKKLTDDDFQVLRLALDGPINKPTPIFHKLRLQMNFNFKEREDIIIQLESFIRQNIYVLEQYSQITLYKLLFIKLLQSIDQDIYQLSQRDIIQVLQIMHIGYRICVKKKSLLESCSNHAELFKMRALWINIQEQITVNVQQQKIMLEYATKFVNVNLCINNNIQLPKIENNQKDNFFNVGLKLFQLEKEKRILPIEALSLTNVMLLSTYISPEYSSDILSALIKSHNVKESEALNQLELQESNYILKPFRNLSRSKVIQEKLISRKKKSIYCLFKSLKFLNMSKDFMQIICVSKEFSREIRDKMIGYHLMNKSVRLNLGPRVHLWKILLDTDSSFKEVNQRFMVSSQKLSSQTEHSIMVDIKRSFNTSQNLRNQIIESYETKLSRLLRLIAYDNPEVSYFQGMNMLMVFLLYVTNLDEDVTFKLFKSLLDKMLRDIFLEGLKIMRKHFFVLDRLMAIYLPDLFIYWRKLKIESPQFATAWYFTLFTYSIQLEDQAANTTCLDMFDVIVAKGWAGFYRVTIALLSYYNNIFLKLDFDQTHKFLNQLTKSSFNLNCQAQEFADVHPFTDIKKRIIQIKKSTIQEIERQYFWFRNKIDQINYNK